MLTGATTVMIDAITVVTMMASITHTINAQCNFKFTGTATINFPGIGVVTVMVMFIHNTGVMAVPVQSLFSWMMPLGPGKKGIGIYARTSFNPCSPG